MEFCIVSRTRVSLFFRAIEVSHEVESSIETREQRQMVQLDQKRNSKSDRVATCSSSFGNVLVRVLSSARVLLFSPSNLEN